MTTAGAVGRDAVPGVALRRLEPHRDERGVFTEIFRDEWGFEACPAAWDLLRLEAGADRALDEGDIVVPLAGSVHVLAGGESVALSAHEPLVAAVAPGCCARLRTATACAVVARGRRRADAARRAAPTARHPELPRGVALMDLPVTSGATALFDADWAVDVDPVQWNAVRSHEGVLRGVHCHRHHADLLCVVEGRMRLGLIDLRGERRDATCLELAADSPQLVAIPPGVAHGFLFLEPSLHVYAVDRTWNPSDELGCRWDDPALEIAWGAEPRSVSARDLGLGSLAELSRTLVG